MTLRTLAIVPARGGSARLVNKNLAIVGGKPLVQHAIDCAVASGVCEHVVLSTDSPWIAMAARGAPVMLRPARLATAGASMEDVQRYVWREAVLAWGRYDAVVLVQPTSPLRLPEDIVACLHLMERTGVQAVVSVSDPAAGAAFHMGDDDRLTPAPVHVCNGAVYVIRGPALEAGHDWYGGTLAGYRMPRDRSIDIDTADQLEEARRLWRAPRS